MIKITSKKVFELVDVFNILPTKIREDRKKLDMDVYSVSEKHYKCGTIHCFAGWFLIANHINEIEKGEFVRGQLKDRDGILYNTGVFEIRCHFGFEDSKESFFDSIGYGLWGNNFKAKMFYSSDAYTPKRKKQADCLQDVLDHWTEVGLRFYIKELYERNEKKIKGGTE